MFFDELQRDTEAERQALLAEALIQRALRGEVTRDQYLAFLAEAYHHVRHTVPLLMACGMRLPERLAWLREAVVDYIAEETGHDQWILADIARAGGDADAVRNGEPCHATDVMIAYAYDGVLRRDPLVFFGMGFVLEGTSVQLATKAATALREALGLPDDAFTYLRSHGELDIEHVRNFAALVNRLETTADRREVTRAARAFYRLYGDVFHAIGAASPA
jgi:pyrroloquinoline quinone (PQQ) biosynthesis protein C